MAEEDADEGDEQKEEQKELPAFSDVTIRAIVCKHAVNMLCAVSLACSEHENIERYILLQGV